MLRNIPRLRPSTPVSSEEQEETEGEARKENENGEVIEGSEKTTVSSPSDIQTGHV